MLNISLVILMGKRELVALLNLSSWCLVMVERLFLTVPRGCLRFEIVVFPDHTHLLVLILILSSTINNVLSKFHSLTNVWSFIDLQSIFKDNLVISSIPNNFNNSETPIICNKYNKPIRSAIFNFNRIVTDIDIASNNPDS